MRVAVIADIHGNLLALEAVLQDLSQQPPVDSLVIAGDLCLNGPSPRQVLERVRALNCPVIQGNVDYEVVNSAPDKGEKKRNTVSWKGADWTGWHRLPGFAAVLPYHLQSKWQRSAHCTCQPS